MWPDDAFAIIEQADNIDAEFGLYLRLLLYTGIRKSEGLAILSADVRPDERAVWLRDSKNDDPRMLKLRENIVGPLEAHLEANGGERLFRFNDGGHFKHLLLRAKLLSVRYAGQRDGRHRNIASRSSDFTPSAILGRPGCAVMPGPICKGFWQRRTGATSVAPHATSTWSCAMNGTASTISPPWGKCGEKRRTSKIHTCNQ